MTERKGHKEMKTRMMVAVLTAVVVGVCGCWSPLVVGEPLMDKDETIYGVHIQPLIGFSKHKVVGVNVASALHVHLVQQRHAELWYNICDVQLQMNGAQDA